MILGRWSVADAWVTFAYLVTYGLIVGYSVSLWRRARKLR